MMTTRTAEISVGIFVAAGLAALFMLAMKVSNLSAYSSDDGFNVMAVYEDASGLKVRSPVTMAGVTIGRVTEIRFEPAWEVLLRDGRVSKVLESGKTGQATAQGEERLARKYVAVVTMTIESRYDNKIPASSDANIYTAGLLGEKYVGFLPGAVSNNCEDAELEAALAGDKATSAGGAAQDCGKGSYLTEGSLVRKTQGTLVLEKLIAQFIDKFTSN